MSYQDILVHLDDGEATRGRLDVALELAGRSGAHLTGIYVDPGLALPALMDVPVAPNLIDELEQEHAARCDAAEQLFREALGRTDVAGEWRLARGEIADTLATADPDTAPNIMEAPTLTCPSPPLTLPNNPSATLIKRAAIPVWVIKSPAKMKNGIAINVKTSIPADNR